MKSHLDLRCSRRLTLQEGRVILDALRFARVENRRLIAKLEEAVTMASHTCNKAWHGRCSVCRQDPAAAARIRTQQAEAFREARARSAVVDRREKNRQREQELRTPRTTPALRLVGSGDRGGVA